MTTVGSSANGMGQKINRRSKGEDFVLNTNEVIKLHQTLVLLSREADTEPCKSEILESAMLCLICF